MITLAELAAKLGGTVKGDGNCVIHKLAALEEAGKGDIAFLANSKYRQHLQSSQASVVILSEEDASFCPTNALILENPYLGFAKVAQLLDTTPNPSEGIADSAVIADDAKLGNNVSIGANTVIESGVVLGDDVIIGANCFIGKCAKIAARSKLWSNISVYHDVVIGEDCLVQANTTIGSDGFGYANDKGRWEKIPQLGSVVIGNSVEIGACTTIDRGALKDTIIGNNCIIDNQVQIAHNVHVGEGTAIAGCAVIAGSTTIGKYCVLAGQTGINGHITIADGCVFTGRSMVAKSIEKAGTYSSGMPAVENREWRRTTARLRQLDDMYKRLSRLEKQLSSANHNVKDND
ncbi:UDP-3-O-(3-hydroxymyristoyl)glucosamine N-acyltransferase [Thalassotalea sp. PS06]|uniref:UDP-3-O-(3-hydroxymyristoyl)glucosamine N-acyltransferase n=1 Tax=Thalassotalea sp. PS06 TaxID=2594005 RepID=UPI0011657B48|nr:UDP-3-O-(3-hydroxymyristoyl)glucosamine N-acyltransferase [Thalassotalea sp. PS06]QDP01729.1 UDP-3-O-(3-hydroxymyristoyl)glucosamine N-acyltransferase [Thalassotalea sp. PS06]